VAKYDPLREHLCLTGERSVTLSFVGIDEIVGGLPRSAGEYREWWANDDHHVQARAWRAAGYKVDSVDLSRCTVRFVKSRW
jgi:hypothetical protein